MWMAAAAAATSATSLCNGIAGGERRARLLGLVPLVVRTIVGLRCVTQGCQMAKFDPLDCAPTPSSLAQSKERKGSNFAV